MSPHRFALTLGAVVFVSACGAAEPEAAAQASGVDTASQADSAPAAAETVDPNADDSPELAGLREKLAKRIPELSGSELRATPVDGLYELSRGMAVGYVTADGRYLLEGDLVDLATGRQITEERRRGARMNVLDDAAKRSIIFGEGAEHMVTVFTDIDCGYCRKMHSEIEQYVDAGIGVRYLLYPRSGQNSDSYRKAVATWCSDDRKATITRAKEGGDPGTKTCDHPVDQHLLAGRQLGLRGTPMIVLPNGEVVQGYLPPQRLAARIEADPGQEPIAAAN